MALVVSSQLIGVQLNGLGVIGISYISLGLLALYFIGARLLAVFQRRRTAEVLDHEAAVLNYAAITPRRAYGVFALTALIVVAAGVWLSSISEGIADETGLGRSFVGALFLGISTSLPEITATITLVRMGAIDLAIGNVLGSNLFNVALLAVYDVFDGGGNLWVAMSPANALAAIISIMMTAVVIVSLIYRASSKTPFRVMWDAPVLVLMYLVAMAALYALS
jgi:cation:H+ antiporter